MLEVFLYLKGAVGLMKLRTGMQHDKLSKAILKTSRSLTFGAAITLGFSCFAYQNYLTNYYLKNAPKSPNFSTEEVVEINEHGRIFYLAGQNKTIYILLPFAGGAILMLSGLIYNAWKPPK